MTRILHVINTTDVDRYENADLTVWDWQGDLNLMEVVDAEGNPLPFEQTSEMQAYWGHDYFTFSVTVKVPAYGYTTVVLREKDPAEVTDCFINTVAWERQHREYDELRHPHGGYLRIRHGAADADGILEYDEIAAKQ